MKNSENLSKTICLVAIVKNESKAILRMLKSVEKIVSTFVIVDTGSKDDTIKIIEEWSKGSGIKGNIYKEKWINFGYNRTQAIKKAKGKADYLLLLDADMEAIIGSKFSINNLTKDQYHIRYIGNLDYAQLLLVKGDLDWEYIGVTHEYIYSKEAKTTGTDVDLTILHYHDGANRKDKFKRDIKLLLHGLKKEPNNSRYMFYLANSYKDTKDYKNALKWYKKRVSYGGFDEEIYYSLYQSARMTLLLGDRDKSKLIYLTAFNYRPTRLEALYEFIKLSREDKQYNVAEMALQKALLVKYPINDVLFVHKQIYKFYILFEFSLMCFYTGKLTLFKKVNKTLLDMKDLPDVLRKQITINDAFVTEDKSEKNKAEKGASTKKNYKVKNFLKAKREEYDSISIIGSGIQIKNFSSIIDNSFVVRLNDYKASHTANKGKVINMIGTSLYPPVVSNLTDKNIPVLGLLPISQKAIIPYSPASNMHKYWRESQYNLTKKGFSVTTYGDTDPFIDIYYDIANFIQGFPTVGIIAIALAEYWGFKKIILSGFTFLQTPDNFNLTTKQKENENLIKSGSTHHKVKKELELFKKWYYNTNIEYIIDTPLKQLLNNE